VIVAYLSQADLDDVRHAFARLRDLADAAARDPTTFEDCRAEFFELQRLIGERFPATGEPR